MSSIRPTGRRFVVFLIAALVAALSAGSASALDGFGVSNPVDLLARQVDATDLEAIRITITPPEPVADDADIQVRIAESPAKIAGRGPFVGDGDGVMATAFILDNSAVAVDRFGMDAIRSAAEQAIAELPKGSRIAIIASGGDPKVISPVTADRQAALASLEGLTAVDGSDRWQALELARDELEGVEGLTNTVVMATSTHTGELPDLLDARSSFAAAGISVFAVGDPTVMAAGLDRMVDLTGGAIVGVSNSESLVDGTVDLAESIGATMWIDAVPSEPIESGVLTSGAVAVGEAELDLTFASGRVSSGHADLSSLQVLHESDGGIFSSPIVKWFGVLLALTASGLAVWAVGTAFVRNEDLDDALSMYDSGSGASPVVEDEDDSQQFSSALGSSATIRRAVDFTGQMADKRGWLTSVSAMLARADIPLRPAEAIFILIILGVLGTVMGLLLGGPLLGLIMLGAAIMLPPTIINFLVRRRGKKFEAALPEMLALIAGTLKAGYSLMQGITTVSEQMEGPMGVELRRVVTETSLGRPLEESLDTVAERMESEDFGWAVMAIRIQREVGGNLAELLLTVADTMTQRERLRREVKSLTAEGRVSAFVLGGLPVGLGLIMYVLNPDYTGMLLTERSGNIALGVAIIVALGGFFWMKKIIDIDV